MNLFDSVLFEGIKTKLKASIKADRIINAEIFIDMQKNIMSGFVNFYKKNDPEPYYAEHAKPCEPDNMFAKLGISKIRKLIKYEKIDGIKIRLNYETKMHETEIFFVCAETKKNKKIIMPL